MVSPPRRDRQWMRRWRDKTRQPMLMNSTQPWKQTPLLRQSGKPRCEPMRRWAWTLSLLHLFRNKGSKKKKKKLRGRLWMFEIATLASSNRPVGVELNTRGAGVCLLCIQDII